MVELPESLETLEDINQALLHIMELILEGRVLPRQAEIAIQASKLAFEILGPKKK